LFGSVRQELDPPSAQGELPFAPTIRYSPFAAFPVVADSHSNNSPFATRHSLPSSDLPICPFHDLPISFGSAGASPSRLLA